MVGDVGIEEEFDLKGISYLGGPGDNDQKVELKAGYAMPHDPDVTLSSTFFCHSSHSPVLCKPGHLVSLLIQHVAFHLIFHMADPAST